MMEAKHYKYIVDAYACLLTASGTERHTTEYQKTLSNLRDCIAKEDGFDPEMVQNVFERYASELRKRTRKEAD